MFRRRHKNLNWVQVQTSKKFVCKSIGDESSTPDEETQNTQNDDNEEDDVATTQSNAATDSETSISRFRSMVTTIAHDSGDSISRLRSMVTTLPPVVFVVGDSLLMLLKV